jgi:WD40 repeat protein
LVFLSRTSEFERLVTSRSYVDEAKTACNAARFNYTDMTDWTASSLPPAEECRRTVLASDVYVGIIGFDHGSPVTDEPELSYTELEYETARQAGRPRLLFLLADEDEPKALDETELGARQARFRARLRERETVAFFRRPDELRRLVTEALRGLPPAPRRGSSAAAPPCMVPSTLGLLVDRPAELDALVEQIRDAARHAPGPPPVVALHGPGGIGKSTLAAEACRRLAAKFPDGVLWIEPGPDPTEQGLVDACRRLLRELGEDRPELADARTAGEQLGRALDGRRALLVVDDVWRSRDLGPFLHGAPDVVRVVTTRVRSALPEETEPVLVGQLTDEQAEALLRRDLPAEEADWSELLRHAGCWPLLVRLVNRALRRDVRAGSTLPGAATALARALAVKGPAWVDPRHEDGERALAATVEATLARLDPDTIELYGDLAVIADDDVPLAVLGRWRGLDEHELTRLARDLYDLALVQGYDVGAGSVRLHSVLREYVVSTQSPEAQRARHAGLLAAHRPASERWADLPEEPVYLWRRLVLHLRRAGLLDELAATVRDVGFLARCVHLVGVPAVLDQLELTRGTAAEGVRDWVRRWSHLLHGLAIPDDVAATLLARPDAPDVLVAGGKASGPALRYADGWSCPEPSGSALDRVLGAHRHRVHTLAWHPDGRRLATAGGDGILRVWDVEGHAEPQVLRGLGWVRAVEWSSDGRRLAAGDDDGVVRVTSLDGTGPAEFRGHGAGVRTLAWAPDGTLASAGDDGVRVWATGPGDPRPGARLEGEPWVRALAWSRDGGRLAVGDDDGAVRVWDPQAGTSRTLGAHEGEVYTVSWSRTHHLASGGADGRLLLWWQEDDEPEALAVPGGPVLAAAWSPGEHVATGSADGTVRVWTPGGAVEPVELGRHEGGALAVAWHPDRRVLASGGGDGQIRLWSVDGGDGRPQLPRPADRVSAVAWSPDGRRLATAGRDGTVRVWAGSDSEDCVALGRHDRSATAVAWLAAGDLVVSGDDDGRVLVWPADPAGLVSPPHLTAPGGCVRALAGEVGGDRLACVGGDGSLLVWEVRADHATLALPRRGEAARSVSWSPHGRQLVTGDDDGVLRIWSAAGEEGAVALGPPGPAVRAVAWSPDGRRVAAGDDAGDLQVWDVDGRRSQPLGRHEGGVHGLGWSPDGTALLSLGCDGQVRVWRRGATVGAFRPAATVALAGVLADGAWRPSGAEVAVAGSYGVYVLSVEPEPVDRTGAGS